MVELYTITSEFKHIKGEFNKDCPDDFIREWLKYKTNLGLEHYSALKTIVNVCITKLSLKEECIYNS